MNYLIPLMVIIPILCALIVNVIGEKNKTTRLLSILVGIAIPVIALVAVRRTQSKPYRLNVACFLEWNSSIHV